ncbi:DUF5602 domain-containing protein [Runella sp. MFBS21]|uniref:DUF5602 domain-containing protein n=1 Tax=Runella sp. MFBS21 TaxID=3034018 RepID=UPI0023F68085|nr:DUF5602 domain-containing protein [Runella sp. MFBS21]MDF7819962.1 DUF5602 domain-containing protein [Runella sp. MFBS21]
MKALFYCLTTLLLIHACTQPQEQQPSLITGPSIPMGSGKANAWVKLDNRGNPASLGFTLSKGAIYNLPTTAAAGEYMLALPDQATQKTPFRHIMINWNPTGHEPKGIYDVAHFDLHFYLVPMNEVMSIPTYDKAKNQFDKNPAPEYLPVGFIKNPGGVPAMGAHWSDGSSPEFKGQPFTETFVFGTYDGKVTFWEQMVAMSFLKTGPSFDKAIAQPVRYAKPGNYPTRYSIRTNADGSYEVALSQFVSRP